MKKQYTLFIILGIIANVILMLVASKKIVVFAPVLFWGIAAFGVFNGALNYFALSNSIKRSKPELYKKYSIGFFITRNALAEESFLKALNDEEMKLIENNKIIFKYLLICFLLFGLSAIVVVLKS